MKYDPIKRIMVEDSGPDFSFLIKDEQEAIDGYKSEMAKTDNPELIKLFNHIISEEEEHIKELKNAQFGKIEVADSHLDDLKEMKSCAQRILKLVSGTSLGRKIDAHSFIVWSENMIKTIDFYLTKRPKDFE